MDAGGSHCFDEPYISDCQRVDWESMEMEVDRGRRHRNPLGSVLSGKIHRLEDRGGHGQRRIPPDSNLNERFASVVDDSVHSSGNYLPRMPSSSTTSTPSLG